MEWWYIMLSWPFWCLVALVIDGICKSGNQQTFDNHDPWGKD